jgi:AmmeMemoRadiSam system protein A
MTTTVVLSDTDRRVLLGVAADVIGDAVARRDPPMPDPSDFSGRLRESGASFVTLERGDQLLGCIGSLVAVEPLVVDVARHALAAAFADPRLPPVTRNDFEEMSIKVSVLTRPEPLSAATFDELVAAVRPGVDGLLVEAGRHRATLLPSVWAHVDDTEQFLGVLWQKAGLVRRAWPTDVAVSRYTTEEFGDPGPRSLVGAANR